MDAALAVVARFIHSDPQQAALALEMLPPVMAADVIRGLPPKAAARVLALVHPQHEAAIYEHMIPEPAASLIGLADPDDAADAFRALSGASRRALLGVLAPERRRELEERLSYPDHSAGQIMRTDVVSFSKDARVRDVVARLKTITATKHPQSYVYVVDEHRRLLGVLNMRDLLLADDDARVESVMRADVLSVPAHIDREELLSEPRVKGYLSIPVVDAQGRLLGAVRTSDLIESSQEEATEDLHRLFGASAEERAFSPLIFKVRQRLPWLTVNLATAFLASAVVALFQDLIGKLAVLAVFLPIVAGQGGNAGVQSLSVVLRGLVIGEVRLRDALRLTSLEVGVGLVNGAVIGLVTALGAWLWNGNPWMGLVIGLAMVVNMVAAGLAGAVIPLGMKRLGFDPAQSSGIFLTTVTDVVGFFSFLGFATLFQARLLPP
ncbi:MAG: magnesium transporter [Elusimicrobia bacterium]|nr:magnesium transporter [Elusimicrobiota bacterium]